MKTGTGEKIFVAKDAMRFLPGETVTILRHNVLWAGCSGEVISEKDGIHLVSVNTKPNGEPCKFSASIPGQELESYL
jgi:hypothetical protein